MEHIIVILEPNVLDFIVKLEDQDLPHHLLYLIM